MGFDFVNKKLNEGKTKIVRLIVTFPISFYQVFDLKGLLERFSKSRDEINYVTKTNSLNFFI